MMYGASDPIIFIITLLVFAAWAGWEAIKFVLFLFISAMHEIMFENSLKDDDD